MITVSLKWVEFHIAWELAGKGASPKAQVSVGNDIMAPVHRVKIFSQLQLHQTYD